MASQSSGFLRSEVMYPPATENGAPHGGALVAGSNAAPVTPPVTYGPGGPEILYGGFNQTWLVNCLRRRWLMASLLGLLMCATAAGLLAWAFPPMHQTTSYLRVKSQAGSDFIEQDHDRISPMEIERQAMNHLALLKSEMVLGAALQRQEIADLDAVRAQGDEQMLWLLDELEVSFPGDGEILEVRYVGEEDPAQMVKVVDAVVDAYRLKVLTADRLQAVSTQTDLATVLENIRESLQEKVESFTQLADLSGALAAEVEGPRLQRKIQMLESQIIEIKEELVDIEVFKQMSLQAAHSPGAMDMAVAMEIDKDPTINAYREQLVALQWELQQKQATSRNQQSAAIKRLAATIQSMEAQMLEYRRNAEKAIRDRLESMPNEQLRAAMAEYHLRVAAANENLAKYEKELADATQRLLEVGERKPELEYAEEQIESEQTIAENLSLKVRQWQIEQQAREAQARSEQQSDFDKVQVIQPALAVENVNKVERWSIAGIGGIAALALTCYGVALLEFRHRRLNGSSDVDEGLGIRVLGVVPPTSLKALAGSSLTATQVAESIDNVRATLMHESTTKSRQVVMVVSPGTMEGSSTVASSLALSLSRAGRRTLLIDGDLRAPTLHKLFGMQLEEGMSELLRSEIDLADAVRPTNNEKLYLLTAGVCDVDAIHALATDQPQAIFDKLREQFDFVVIDAPPVIGVSDSLSLGQYVDGAVLTVLRDHSEIRQIHQATELLKRMGVRLIGAVVNGVSTKADRRVVRLHQATAKRTLRLPAKADA